MKKLLLRIGIGALAVGLFLVLAKNGIASWAVSSAVKAVTGFRLGMESLDVGILNPTVRVKGLTLFNPAGFPEPVMVKMPELSVDYDLPAFFTGKVHLRRLRIHLEEFIVVKDKNGRLNLDALRVVQKKKESAAAGQQKAKPIPVQIDLLDLSIGRAIYKDYSGSAAGRVQEFNVNLDERYQNVTDLNVLASLIITRCLVSTAIGRLSSFELGPLAIDANQVVKGATGVVSGAFEGAKDAVDTLKGILK
ncbi:MAG: hypothetical protein HYZ93_04065 [Candidatus Omnitrophica bacterium]|nr:hypothetical protein [Candidatus Omnitrophota bacterium]